MESVGDERLNVTREFAERGRQNSGLRGGIRREIVVGEGGGGCTCWELVIWRPFVP